MIQLIAMIAMACAAVAGYWFPLVAWIFVGIIGGFLSGQLITVRRVHQLPEIGGLSFQASQLARAYGHYFILPMAAKDFSAAAATVQLGSILLAVVTWVAEFRLGALVAVGVFGWMGYVATSFSPLAKIRGNQELAAAHDEVFAAMNRQ